MDFNPTLHHGLSQPDQKPHFLHHEQGQQGYLDPYNHHHHRAPVDPLAAKPGAAENGRGPYGFQSPSPDLGDSFDPHPPHPPSDSSSPSPVPPVSAAAEYMRHQELSRAGPRKRIYQDWNQVAIYNTPSEAEEGIRAFENCRWKVGNKFTSREGFKVYWSCREGAGCPVQIHLLYHSQLPRVVLYRNQPDHHHAERVKTRGLPAPVEALIRDLFSNGVNKPRRIQFILQKRGLEEVPQTKLSNFLVKLRREAAMHGEPVTKRGRGSYEYDDEEEDGLEGGFGRDEKSNHTMSSMSPSSAIFPSVIISTPPGADEQGLNYHQGAGESGGIFGGFQHPSMPGSSRYSGQGTFQGGSCGSENSSPFPFGGRGSDSAPSHAFGGGGKAGEDPDQSGVVTCSSSPTKTLYCRDESTEDGEHCLPDEEDVKEKILDHLRTNYSNRDMLHIRQELRTLKRENKYTALNRLLSFTAGFLQDTFLESLPKKGTAPRQKEEQE